MSDVMYDMNILHQFNTIITNIILLAEVINDNNSNNINTEDLMKELKQYEIRLIKLCKNTNIEHIIDLYPNYRRN